MDMVLYYNNRFYALFLAFTLAVLCAGKSFAENYLIPPGDRELSRIEEYLDVKEIQCSSEYRVALAEGSRT